MLHLLQVLRSLLRKICSLFFIKNRVLSPFSREKTVAPATDFALISFLFIAFSVVTI
jgi:hypothetical protein